MVALNLAALLIAVATYLSRARGRCGFLLWPWCRARRRVPSSCSKATRPFGIGCLSGTALSASVFLVLFLIFFVTNFVVLVVDELSDVERVGLIAPI